MTTPGIYTDAQQIVPSDVATFEPAFTGLFFGYVGSGGGYTCKVMTAQGTIMTLNISAVPFILPLSISMLFATGTTITNVVGLY